MKEDEDMRLMALIRPVTRGRSPCKIFRPLGKMCWK